MSNRRPLILSTNDNLTLNNNKEIKLYDTDFQVYITGNDGDSSLGFCNTLKSYNTYICSAIDKPDLWTYHTYTATVSGNTKSNYTYLWNYMQTDWSVGSFYFSGGTRDQETVNLAINPNITYAGTCYKTDLPVQFPLSVKVTDQFGNSVITTKTIYQGTYPYYEVSGSTAPVSNRTITYYAYYWGGCDKANSLTWYCSGGTITSGQGTTACTISWGSVPTSGANCNTNTPPCHVTLTVMWSQRNNCRGLFTLAIA